MPYRRGHRSAAVLALAAAGLACPAAVPRAAAAVPRSDAAQFASARMSAVVSGDGRFEVLSPTLIRTEYAGDARFIDAATFNAIGRDGFAPAHFTTQTAGGWLTIQTQAVTLRYRAGSGPFGADNLQVLLRAGR